MRTQSVSGFSFKKQYPPRFYIKKHPKTRQDIAVQWKQHSNSKEQEDMDNGLE